MTQILLTDGQPEAKFWVIARDFGNQERLAGKPMQGLAGGRLWGALREAGFREADVFVDNVIRAQPPRNDWEAHDYQTVLDQVARLQEQIRRWKPAMIVAVGNQAFHTVMGHHPDEKMLPPITDCRGYLFNSPLGPRVMPIVHPAAIDRRGDGGLPWVPYMKLLHVDIAKAWREMQAGCPALPEREVHILTTVSEWEAAWTDVIRHCSCIALDIENDSDLNLSCLGIGVSDDVSVVLPNTEDWQLEAIRQVCESDIPKVLQNGQYDRYFLKYKPEDPNDPSRAPHYDIEIRNQVADSILQWHSLQPELAGAREDPIKTKRMRRSTKKALKFLISIFLRDGWHKDYRFEAGSDEQMILCGKDCCTTLAIAKILATELGSSWEEFLR